MAADDAAHLEQIYDIYGQMPPFRLSEITHEPSGSWDIASKTGGNCAPILNELILSHYENKRRKAVEVADG